MAFFAKGGVSPPRLQSSLGGFDEERSDEEPCGLPRGNHPSRIPPPTFLIFPLRSRQRKTPSTEMKFQSRTAFAARAARPPRLQSSLGWIRRGAKRRRAVRLAARQPPFKNPPANIFDFSVAKRRAEKAIRSKRSFGVVWLFKRRAVFHRPGSSPLWGGFDEERSDEEPCVLTRGNHPPKNPLTGIFDFSVAKRRAKKAIDRNKVSGSMAFIAKGGVSPPRKNQKWWWEVDSNHRKRS